MMWKLVFLLLVGCSKNISEIHYIHNGFFGDSSTILITQDTNLVKQVFQVDEVGSATALTDPGRFLVWIYKEEDIMHESFHLTKAVLEYRSIYLSDETEELYAYVQEYYYFEIKKLLNGK